MPTIDPKSARAEAKAAKARAKALRPWYRKKRWWVLGVLVVIVVIVVVVSAGTKSTTVVSPPSHLPANTPSAAGTVLLTRAGSGSASTGTFTAPTNWDLKWTYNCSSIYGGSGNFIVSVEQNPNSGTMAAAEDIPVNQIGTSGSGTEHYHYGGGGVYLTVNSLCTWTVTAVAA
jgi:hypothetical protein